MAKNKGQRTIRILNRVIKQETVIQKPYRTRLREKQGPTLAVHRSIFRRKK